MAKLAVVRKSPDGQEPERPRSKIMSVRIPAELDHEIRLACFDLGHEFNISRFAVEALTAHITRYRKQFNGGKPWRGGSVRLKMGRPMKPPRG